MRRPRAAAVAAAALLVAGAGGACSEENSVFNIEVGDCVENVSSLTDAVSELPSVECTDEHDGEVIALFQHERDDDDDFPGEAALRTEAAEECAGDAFEAYTGVPYVETSIGLSIITPSEESWGTGDRESICVATTGGLVDESFADNGGAFPADG